MIYWTGHTVAALPSMITEDARTVVVDKAGGTEPQKIRDAQGSLDERIAELEEALEEAQSRLADVRRLSDRIQYIGSRVPDDLRLAEEALAA